MRLETLRDYVHSVTIGSGVYSCNQDGLTAAQIASNIAAQITANDPNCSATADADGNSNDITITLRSRVQVRSPCPVGTVPRLRRWRRSPRRT